MPIEAPTRPWKAISVDMVGPLSLLQGHDALLVVVDRFTKQIHAILTQIELLVARLAQLYLAHVWKLHGLPHDIISDREMTFVAQFTKELSARLGITLSPSTAYHPQTDGQTE